MNVAAELSVRSFVIPDTVLDAWDWEGKPRLNPRGLVVFITFEVPLEPHQVDHVTKMVDHMVYPILDPADWRMTGRHALADDLTCIGIYFSTYNQEYDGEDIKVFVNLISDKIVQDNRAIVDMAAGLNN